MPGPLRAVTRIMSWQMYRPADRIKFSISGIVYAVLFLDCDGELHIGYRKKNNQTRDRYR